MSAVLEIKRQRRTRRSRWKVSEAFLILGRPLPTIEVPEAVWAEREKRLKVLPTSITAIICGDPLPGYSALDKVS